VRISRADFHQLVLRIPELALAVITDLSGKVEHLTGLVNDLSLKNVRARLAKFLLAQQAQKQKARWTQSEIASQLGTSREIVSRLLKAFASEELIAIERHKITVRDENKLRTEI
jgi:CRP-like cAMP-binding protein